MPEREYAEGQASHWTQLERIALEKKPAKQYHHLQSPIPPGRVPRSLSAVRYLYLADEIDHLAGVEWDVVVMQVVV